MNTVLRIENLNKKYKKVQAVKNLSLEVKEGTVHGLLGPNGSGKTTTFGVVLDVIKRDSGTYAWFDGLPPKQSRKKLGVILETPAFYPYLSAIENLKIAATIKGYGINRIDKVLQQVNLYERRNSAFKTFSLGMKQRLALASALIADPPVLLLDEPTNGLDPQGIAEVRSLITDLANEGKTILLASHMLDEVQKVCTHFTVMRKGEKVYEGNVEEALATDQHVEIASDDMTLLKQTLNEMDLRDLREEKGRYKIKLSSSMTTTELNRLLIDKGIVVSHLTMTSSSLEQYFLNILKENHD